MSPRGRWLLANAQFTWDRMWLPHDVDMALTTNERQYWIILHSMSKSS
jgi:hypothetical protein